MAVGAAIALVLFVMPFPLHTVAEGITWPSERSQMRAGTDGFIGLLLVPNKTPVAAGEPIIETFDPILNAKVKVLEAQLRGLRRQFVALRASDPAEAAVIQQEINGVASDLERARERQRDLIIVSPRAGIFVAPVDQDMPGRFVKKGELVGYVIDSADLLTARTMISQNDIALVRDRTRGVDVLPVRWEGRSAHTAVIREVPGGLKALPTPALGGGGNAMIATDRSRRLIAISIRGMPPSTRAFRRAFTYADRFGLLASSISFAALLRIVQSEARLRPGITAGPEREDERLGC